MRGLVLAGLILGAAPAVGQDALLTGTMKTLADRGSIRIGYREASVPFSFLNPGKQPVGFSLDLCHAIAADAAAALGRELLEPGAPGWQQGLRIDYVPVSAEGRLPMLVSGQIDLECGSTTANAERAKTIAFSPVFFLAGTKLAVPASSSAASYRDLAGKTVAVSAGTTNATAVQHLAATTAPPLKAETLPSVEAAYALLAQNKVDAIASDDILLVGLLAAHAATKQYRLIGDYLSFEPYAIGFRRNDEAFAGLIQQSFAGLADSGMLTASYNRWFLDKLPNGETLGCR